MRIEFAAFSNVGPRNTNDDRYLEPRSRDAASVVVAIADGMGGAAGGGTAATLAIDAAKEALIHRTNLSAVFDHAVSEIKRHAERKPEFAKMGTTLSLAVLETGQVFVAHVGDTRIYHIRGSGLNSLTQDQTEIAELVRRGVFTSAQARRYPRRNVLLSALTAKAEYTVMESSAALMPGDRIVLLSDGVHQRLNRRAILELSVANPTVMGFVIELERKVIDASPSDNFTAVALQLLEL